MTAIYLCYISLWTVFIGVAQTCPEPCVCVDKYAHQFADCAYKDLQVVPVGLPSNVTTLSLSANKIKTLLKNSFVNVTQVTSLWLAHNEIVTIEKGTLAVLVQLRNLDLSHNQVVHFPWGDLYNLTSLQLLKINNNNMVDLPRDAFSNLKDLRSLRINNNMFTTIAKGSFDSLSSMSHLQIYNNPFDCTCTLHWLKDWVANALISVPEPDLITCETPEDLKGIRIVQLPNLECVAPTIHIMSQPNLENTQINEGFMLIMHCNVTGSPKPEVKWKIRTGNQEIEFNMPITETKKNDLPLENSKQAANRFLVFKNGTLVIPRTSKREDGRYTCSATNVQGSTESSVNVAVAGTQKHAINAIQDAILDKTPTSERKPGVKVSKNNVINWAKPDDTGKMTFPTRATYGSFGTQRSGVVISPGQPAFGKKCGVTSLWLAHNEIVTIEKGTLAVLVQLRNLDLSHNQVVHFPWGDLYNLTSLQLLKINNNNMVDLPRDAFSNLKDLRSLRINNNMFTTIAKGSFDSLSSMSHLQIYNNPFDCTCTLHWLKDWVANALISVPEPDLITCETPEDLKGIRIVQLPNLECVAPTVHIMSQPNLENTQINEGFMLIMHCNVTGSPKPEVKWKIRTGNQEIEFNMPITETKKNDLPLENSKQAANRFLVFKNGTLVIPRTSKREDGRYTCSATNVQGSTESSVNVAVAGTQKHAINAIQDAILDKTPTSERKPGVKVSKNNVINWAKPDDTGKMTFPTRATYGSFGTQRSGVVISPGQPAFGKKCGVSDSTQYISNHAFNQSSDELKQHTFDFGVIALEVSETEAKVQLNPFQAPTEKAHLEMLYLCINMGNGHSVVQWSKIEDGINAYQFQGLNPGTNYTLCLTYTGEDCQVQVVFTTRKKIPSLMIIVVVSTFLLALATVPLLGATCCHLLYKYQGKTYKLIMKAHNPDQMEKHMATDFDPRASYVEKEKNYNPSDLEEDEVKREEGEGEGEWRGV
ncbi:Immunoglobulin superfamily containing leucine-rich repeat protein 2 [Acipenser ruthenus]|nr:Immunoglobulin superfamily containing leucine-rich repeat protein 2 [Acipenser ruthenus]